MHIPREWRRSSRIQGRPSPPSSRPPSGCGSLAVAAGLFETALVVVDATDGEIGSVAQVAVGVAVRLLVFTAAVYLAIQLRRGKNWARVALAELLGGIGTGSLVIGPVTWLAAGGSPTKLWRPPTWGRCCSRPVGSCTWGRSSRHCS